MKTYIINRFTLTFGTIFLAALLWNAYVLLNDDGIIRGRVVDQSGVGVGQATVILSRETVTSVEKVNEALTNEKGQFSFDRHGEYSIVMSASKGELKSTRRTIPLWFRNQNVNLDAPLVLIE